MRFVKIFPLEKTHYVVYIFEIAHRYENYPKNELMEKLLETERELKKYQERFRHTYIHVHTYYCIV